MAHNRILVSVGLALLTPVAAASGPYVGASVGQSDLPFHYSGDGDAWAAHVGYRFGNWFAVEGSYSDLTEHWRSCPSGNACIPEGQYGISYAGRNLDVLFLGTLPLGSRVALVGAAGVGRLQSRLRTSAHTDELGNFIPEATTRNADSGLILGAGVDVHVARAWDARLQWNRQHVSGGSVKTAWLGFTWSIGR